ncbi:MAG: hypothetical protein RBS08_06595 [Bdellovibrionales bacterium]|jgi:hypothetical protein|nr:hypothetical protein [Bdellovibrionales bacterium]
MKRFVILSALALMISGAVPAFAQVSDADARLMENLAADEEAWAADEEAEILGEPDFREEQNPQESMRRMPAPAPEGRGQPQIKIPVPQR